MDAKGVGKEVASPKLGCGTTAGCAAAGECAAPFLVTAVVRAVSGDASFAVFHMRCSKVR